MKKYLIAVLVAALPGCALLDAYTMAGFDANEYQLATEIRTIAEVSKKECSDNITMITNARDLLYVATEFKNYTASIPNNDEATSMAKNLLVEVQGLDERYKTKEVSKYYCNTKMLIIERSAKTIQISLGVKPR